MTHGGPQGRTDSPIDAHAPTEIPLDDDAWRNRRARRRRQKVVTKDLSRMDLSAQAVFDIDRPHGEAAVTRELRAIVAGLSDAQRLAVRAAILSDKHVDAARRIEILGVPAEAHHALALQGQLEIEIQLRARCGFVPRYQLRWCGSV